MVEKKVAKRSRRAERREKAGKDASQQTRDESAEDADESEADEPEADESEDADESETDEPDDVDEPEADEADSAEDAPAAAAPNRAQRRAAAARRRKGLEDDGEADREEIRTRNRGAREDAARRRKSKRRAATEDSEVAVGLDATEMVDDVLARVSFKTTRWVRDNSFLVQGVLLFSFLGVIGWSVYRWYAAQTRDTRSDALFTAVERQTGHVGEPVEAMNAEGAVVDPRPTYNTAAEQLADAEAAYREALAQGGQTRATTVLAQLGLAGVLLQQGKWEEALVQYQAVKGSDLAKRDPQVLGRAQEGVGLALEGKGDQAGALGAFQELEGSGVDRFSKLGMYHRARLAYAKGDTTLAKELVAKLKEKVGTSDNPFEPGYLAVAKMELEMALDPNATGGPMAALKQLEEIQRQARDASASLKKLGLEGLPLDLELDKGPGDKTPVAPSASAATPGSATPPAAPAPAPVAPAPAGSR